MDGWLFFDHHGRDPLAYRVLGFRPRPTVRGAGITSFRRRASRGGWCIALNRACWIRCRARRSGIRAGPSRRAGLKRLLGGARRVAMQYSHDCAIPYVAMVDAGTVELVREQGVEVVTLGGTDPAF